MANMSLDRQNLARNSIVGDAPVTNGDVDNYDFDWGEEVVITESDVMGGCDCCLNEEPKQTENTKSSCVCDESPQEDETRTTPAQMDYEILDL